MSRWSTKLQRTDAHVVSKWTVVCGNHFRHGRPTESSRIPELYLRGYPAWALTVEQCQGMISKMTNTNDQLSILKDVCKALHCKVAHDIIIWYRTKFVLSSSLSDFMTVNPNNALACLLTSLDCIPVMFVPELLEKVTSYVFPGVTHWALAKHILCPGTEIYLGSSGLSRTQQSTTKFQRQAIVSSSPMIDVKTAVSTAQGPTTSVSHTHTAMSPTSISTVSSSGIHQRSTTQQSPKPSPQKDKECNLYSIALFHNYCSTPIASTAAHNENCSTSPVKKQQCQRKVCKRNRTIIQKQKNSLKTLMKKIATHENKIQSLLEQNHLIKAQNKELTVHDNDLMNLHTGLPTYGHFRYIYLIVEEPAKTMQYWRGETKSKTIKRYQIRNQKKPGRPRQISLENELLMTLMKLRLNLTEAYLGYLFNALESSVSKIITTWLLLLNEELKPLIYWPPSEIVQRNQPLCFDKWGGRVRAIIDCTEVPIQHPSLAEANTKTFSSYKNTTTSKFLIACTPHGLISYVSPPAGGRMSDPTIFDKSRLAEKFTGGDICMADKGFRIQHFLLNHGAELVMPPFTRKGKQFTNRKNKKTQRNRQCENSYWESHWQNERF